MRIVVLGGGLSTERQVSLVTATSVCRALRSLGHKAIFVDMFLGINEETDLQDLFEADDGLCSNVEVGHETPDLQSVIEQREYQDKSRIGRNVIEVCKLADCVFLGLHGEDGEDGKIQAVLDLYGIPYTGSGTLGSAMAMDKITARLIMKANNIKCAPEIDYAPCVVKCAHGGSSIGTFICDTDEQLRKALVSIKQYNDEVLIEKKISGMELTVPVIDGKALCPIEIVPPKSGRFDYVAKYQSGNEGAKEICPARLDKQKTAEVQEIAEKLHKALKLSVYSRTDFIMDADGVFWCLEVNTLPGMTPNSLIPKAAKEAGIDYAQLCDLIVNLSLQKVK